MAKQTIINLDGLIDSIVTSNVNVVAANEAVVESTEKASEATDQASAAESARLQAEAEAVKAATSASEAKGYKDTAVSSANTATIQADLVANSVAEAALEAEKAKVARNIAETYRNDCMNYLAATNIKYDMFDDRFLGAKASNPTTDNDGFGILTGAMYWNTTNARLMIFTGTVWIAVVNSSGGLQAGQNLADLPDKGVARTNLGVYSTTEANAAYEPKDGTILKDADIGVTVQGYSANTVIDSVYVHTDNNYTTTEKSKLSGIASGAEVNVNADWTAVSGDAQILNKPTTISGYGITDAYTKAETGTEISDAIATLVDSSPATLDTLNELAAALGDDPNFATTVSTALGNRVVKNADIVAGTATKITYDVKGLVTAGETPTTLAGYSIADAYTDTEVDVLLGSKLDKAFTNTDTAGAGILVGHTTKEMTKGLTAFTGAVQIELTGLYAEASMVGRMKVVINQAVGADRVLYIDGRWLSTTHAWDEANVLEQTTASDRLNVRFAKDTTNSKVYLVIGETTTVWNALRITIDEVLTNYNESLELGFIISSITSLSGLTVDYTKVDTAKVIANTAITAGTATKVTYDVKGLVTGGTTLSAVDIPTIAATGVSVVVNGNLSADTVQSALIELQGDIDTINTKLNNGEW